MLINSTSKQLKSMTLNKQIVIGKYPKQSKIEKHITSLKKKRDELPHISQFCLNLLSNQISTFLHQPSPTSHTCFLMPQKYFTEVLEQWLTNDWPAINSLITKETEGLGIFNQLVCFMYFVSLSVFDILSTWVNGSKNQRLYEAEALCYDIVLKQYSRVYTLI